MNWQVLEWPFLARDTPDTISVQGAAQRVLWFDKVDDHFVAAFDRSETLELDDSENVYRLVEQDGTVTEFNSTSGMFERRISPGGELIEVKALHSSGYNFTQVERSYTEGGQTMIEQYSYDYDDATGDILLSTVTLRRKVEGGSWTNVARASYTYYADDDSNGGESDLQSVTTEVWDGSDWSETGTSLYRYYLESPSGSSSSSSSSSGSELPPHLLKYVVQPEAYEKLKSDPNVPDPLTVSDFYIAQYADYYFEYDELRRVTRETVQGGSRTYTFGYEESGFSEGYNRWQMKTSETLPNGARNIIFSNYAGQTMLHVFQSDSDEWCEFQEYDNSGRVVLHAHSSAIGGYDETKPDLLNKTGGSYQHLKATTGLITRYTWHEPSGYIASESIQQGQTGTLLKVREYEYTSCGAASGGESSSSSSSSSATGGVWFTSKETEYPSSTDQTKKLITAYDYTFYPGTCQIQQRTTTLPTVGASQNGSGTTATRQEVFDVYGNLTWQMDERGFITRLKYNIETGAITQSIQDVDTAQVTDEPSGWETPSGDGLHLITDYEHDDLGRTTQVLGPVHSIDLEGTATQARRASWTVYRDSDREIRSAQGYATGTSFDTLTLVNPVRITRSDRNGMLLEQIEAARASTAGALTAADSFPQSSYTAWSTYQYTECCLLSSTRVYHTIPASGTGTEGSNYDETAFGYAADKQQNRQVSPGGTITRTVRDVRDQVVKTYVGTDDTSATDSDPTGGGATGNNMVLLSEYEYDDGNDGFDGNLTKQTQHVDGSTTRVTSFSYDWRNRLTATDGEEDFYEERTYDNLDRVVKVERRDTTSSGNLVSRSETKYDDRGRVYEQVRYGVDPASGTVGQSLTDKTWYDAAGNVLKQQSAGSEVFTKFTYDGLGRRTAQYQGYDLDESAYGEVDDVDGDTIVEQTETSYDPASNAIQTTHRQRYHNATGTGALGTPGSTQPKARVTYSAAWHDGIGRTQAQANYGTNGGSSLSRPATIPVRSDTVLVTSMGYDSAGRLGTTKNPGGITSCFEYDAAGRQVRQIMNCSTGSSSSSSSSGGNQSDDGNVTVETAYNADGNVSSITAKNPITGDQVTRYVYGTTLTDSGIASSQLKRAEIYPDSDDVAAPLGNGPDETYDRIEFKYNRQGEVVEVKDQNGTVHSYDYDLLGRQTHDRVTTVGTGIDGGVRRISSTFEVRGMRAKITSYNSETVGSGSVVNEVQFTYNDFGQITADYQAHGGSVNTSTTPKVQYGYASGAANTIRPTSLTYPDGRTLTYDYGAADSMPDALSRIAAIVDDDGSSTHLADYSYVGLRSFVEVDYTEPNIRYTLVGVSGGNDPDTGDIYRGLDRFGRVKDCRWHNYNSATDVDRIKYGYDRNGNRLWRENVVASEQYAKNFDELYGYDQIDRLQTMDRGDLTSLKDAIQNKTFAQDWALDPVGNWKNFREDDNGDSTWDLNQQRAANKVNEISNISVGPAWVTPAYDRAGNMTTIPKPADPTIPFTATYDPWNRLVKIEEPDGLGGTQKLAEYAYDGAKRRTVKKTYSGGSLDQTRYFFYTEPSQWQVVEERVDSSSDPDRQFVWGLRYIDDLLLRDRDTNADGALDERLYALQDANWNVTALADDSASITERYIYSPYGTIATLTGWFGTRHASLYKWEILLAGYRFDWESELYCVRRRCFHACLGVWTQRDPSGYSGSEWDLYEYVNSSPIVNVDPTGEAIQIPIIGIIVFMVWVALCSTCYHYYLKVKAGKTLGQAERFLYQLSCYLCVAVPLMVLCKRFIPKGWVPKNFVSALIFTKGTVEQHRMLRHLNVEAITYASQILV